MTAPFHSPSPWTLRAGGGALTIESRDKHVVAILGRHMDESNGPLLAAAPEMFEALRDAVARCAMLRSDNPESHKCPTCEDWRAALAKAVGR